MSYRFYPKQEDEEYLKSGRWKCGKSPTGSHHWIYPLLDGSLEQCKYCPEVRELVRNITKSPLAKRYPKNWKKNDNQNS